MNWLIIYLSLLEINSFQMNLVTDWNVLNNVIVQMENLNQFA